MIDLDKINSCLLPPPPSPGTGYQVPGTRVRTLLDIKLGGKLMGGMEL